WFAAGLIRLDFRIDNQAVSALIGSLPWVMIATCPAFALAGVYRAIWRHTGVSNVLRFAEGSALGALAVMGVSQVRLITVDGSTAVLFGLLAFNLLVASRLSFRFLRAAIGRLAAHDERVLIVGAGELGETAARSL